MARTKTKKKVYVVANDAPVAVFSRLDLALQYGAEKETKIHGLNVLTEADLRAEKRAAAMDVLTPEQRLHLGLVKKNKAVAETGN